MKARRSALSVIFAAALVLLALLLSACGGSGKGLISPANAGPLQADFDSIQQAVSDGDCPAMREALSKAAADLEQLPSSVDLGLRQRLNNGLADLTNAAPGECAQNAASLTTSSTTSSTTTTSTTTTTSSTSSTTTSSTTTSTSTTLSPPTPTVSGGGTPFPSSTTTSITTSSGGPTVSGGGPTGATGVGGIGAPQQ
jgi:hypothetical protein